MILAWLGLTDMDVLALILPAARPRLLKVHTLIAKRSLGTNVLLT